MIELPVRGTLAPVGPVRMRRRFGRGEATVAISTVIALALLLPLGLLGLDARAAGWGEIHRVLFRERSWYLLQHTVEISVLVVLFSATIGVATAWCTERTRIPGRRAWTVLLVLPVAIPDFVVGYAWHSIDPTINGLLGATLVMTLGTYPLVYLPVAAALRRTDPAMEDTAHSLGVGPARTFWRASRCRSSAPPCSEDASSSPSPSSRNTGRSRSCASRPSPPRSSPSSSSTPRRRGR